jgi:hypothetical protein
MRLTDEQQTTMRNMLRELREGVLLHCAYGDSPVTAFVDVWTDMLGAKAEVIVLRCPGSEALLDAQAHLRKLLDGLRETAATVPPDLSPPIRRAFIDLILAGLRDIDMQIDSGDLHVPEEGRPE